MSDEESAQPRSKRPASSGAFTKNDPRQSVGRPKGIPNKVTRAAIELLQLRALEMVEKLTRIATEDERENEDPCPMCGRGMRRSEDLQIKAIIAALDRAGIGAHSKVEVTEKNDTEWMQFLTDSQLDTLNGWVSEARARMGSEVGEGDENTETVN